MHVFLVKKIEFQIPVNPSRVKTSGANIACSFDKVDALYYISCVYGDTTMACKGHLDVFHRHIKKEICFGDLINEHSFLFSVFELLSIATDK